MIIRIAQRGQQGLKLFPCSGHILLKFSGNPRRQSQCCSHYYPHGGLPGAQGALCLGPPAACLESHTKESWRHMDSSIWQSSPPLHPPTGTTALPFSIPARISEQRKWNFLSAAGGPEARAVLESQRERHEVASSKAGHGGESCARQHWCI